MYKARRCNHSALICFLCFAFEPGCDRFVEILTLKNTKSAMEADKRFTACRLCLCPSEILIGVFEYQDGYTLAEIITELLRFEVSVGDIYPQCICGVCSDKLKDFKKFKELCCVFKASIDRAYAARNVIDTVTALKSVRPNPMPCKIEEVPPNSVAVDIRTTSVKEECENDVASGGELIIPDDTLHNHTDQTRLIGEEEISRADEEEMIIPDITDDNPLALETSSVTSLRMSDATHELTHALDEGAFSMRIHPERELVKEKGKMVPMHDHEAGKGGVSDEDDAMDVGGGEISEDESVDDVRPSCETRLEQPESLGIPEAVLHTSAEMPPIPDIFRVKNEELETSAVPKAGKVLERPDSEDDGGNGDATTVTNSGNVLRISSPLACESSVELSSPKNNLPQDVWGTEGRDEEKPFLADGGSKEVGVVSSKPSGEPVELRSKNQVDPRVSEETGGRSDDATPSTSNDLKESSSSLRHEVEEPSGRARRVTRSMLAPPTQKKAKKVLDAESDDDVNDMLDDLEDSSSNFSYHMSNSETSDASDEEFLPTPAKMFKGNTQLRGTRNTARNSKAGTASKNSTLIVPQSKPGVMDRKNIRKGWPSSDVERDLPASDTMNVSKESTTVREERPVEFVRCNEIIEATLRKYFNADAEKSVQNPPPPSLFGKISGRKVVRTSPLRAVRNITSVRGSQESEKNNVIVPKESLLMQLLMNPDEVNKLLPKNPMDTMLDKEIAASLISKETGGMNMNSSDVVCGESSLETNVIRPVGFKVPGELAVTVGSKDGISEASNSEITVLEKACSSGVGEEFSMAETSLGKKIEAEGRPDDIGEEISSSSSSSETDDSDWDPDDPGAGGRRKDKHKTSDDDELVEKERSVNSVGGQVFKCHVCGKTYMTWRNYRDHMKAHIYGNPFKCDTCGKSFLKKCNLDSHQDVHVVDRNFKCDICSKSFKSNSHLVIHKKLHGDAKYMCEQCGKKFTKLIKLKLHSSLHVKEKKFPCDTCGKAFPNTKYLKRHQKNLHSGKSKEYRYDCDECGKKFVSKAQLRVHIRIHTGERPFICSLCGKGMRTKTMLLVHMNTHTREKSYKCEICDTVLSSINAYNRHKNRHSGEKRFKCDKCGKEYTQSHNLKNHKMKYHIE